MSAATALASSEDQFEVAVVGHEMMGQRRGRMRGSAWMEMPMRDHGSNWHLLTIGEARECLQLAVASS